MGASFTTRPTQDLGLVSLKNIDSHLLHCYQITTFAFRGPDSASLSWQKPESDGGKAISHYQLEVRENKMTEFVKGKVFTIAEVRENKEGQILAKVVS